MLDLVEGETLDARLKPSRSKPTGESSEGVRMERAGVRIEREGVRMEREGFSRAALPITEALAIARQIVDALEAAHEKGIMGLRSRSRDRFP